jgi:hypothetical protein
MIDAMNRMKSKGNFGLPSPHMVEVSKGEGLASSSSLKNGGWAHSAQFGLKLDRQFNRQFTTIHGLREFYNVLTAKVDERSGETRSQLAQRAIGSTFRTAALGELQSQMFAATATYKASRQSGASRSRSLGRATGSVTANAIRAVGTLVIGSMFDYDAEVAHVRQKSRYDIAEAKNGWNEQLRPNKLGEKQAVKPLSAEGEQKFHDRVYEDSTTYNIDPVTGERVRRGWFDSTVANMWIVKWLWKEKEIEAETNYRIKKSQELHESATKKGEMMDWKGAIEETRQAKELIVAEEAMPYFWKQPEDYLRSMEASRIAARNWARSQQPRGGDRTGD